jgi:hypothetical protein
MKPTLALHNLGQRTIRANLKHLAGFFVGAPDQAVKTATTLAEDLQ